MAVAFKTMTTHRLVVLLAVFLFGNSSHLLPADPAGLNLLYVPVALLSGSLLFTTVTGASIILSARALAAVSSADAKPAACKQGFASLSVRQRLRLAIAFSAASTLLAIFTFEIGFQYRKGRVSVLSGWPAWALMAIMGLEHGLCAMTLD